MRYEVMAEENEAKRNVYRIMMDENGISIWMNDLPLHEIGYGAEFEWVSWNNLKSGYLYLFSNLDVGEQMEVVVSMVAGKKPGAFVTIIGVATIQFTFKVGAVCDFSWTDVSGPRS